jgi:putative oxidoreductase
MLSNIHIGLLIMRLVVGFILAGHGAQKLFGWFGGRGLAGQAAIIEKLDIHPVYFWTLVSALSEFLGGLGLALGLLTPLAAAVLVGAMVVAIAKVHWANGLWNSNRGFEFPLALAVIAFVVGLTGPGLYSLDYALHLTLPEPITYLIALVVVLIGVAVATAPIQSVHRPEHKVNS